MIPLDHFQVKGRHLCPTDIRLMMILTFGSTATHDATSDQISNNYNMYLHFTRLKTRLTSRVDNGELSQFRSVGGTKRIPGK